MSLGDAAQPQAVRSHGVLLDAYAFIKGWLIATSLWVGVLLLLVAAYYGVPAARDGTDAGYVWGFLGMVVFYGFGVALVFAAPLAWVLARVPYNVAKRPPPTAAVHTGLLPNAGASMARGSGDPAVSSSSVPRRASR